MRRADRLFHLVQVLRNRRLATAEQLAEDLEVSTRTVYRDVQDLQASGVPIRGEAGVGYSLQRGYELPPLTFNAEELEALVLGARVVETWGDTELAGASRSAMTKVEAVLPSALKHLLHDTMIFAPRGPRAMFHASGYLGVIRKALANRQKVHFRYFRADFEESERTVRPLGLHFWGAKWSLASWCELRTDYRNFRLDRMADVVVLDEVFDGKDGITLAAYLAKMEEEAARDGYEIVITGAGPSR